MNNLKKAYELGWIKASKWANITDEYYKEQAKKK